MLAVSLLVALLRATPSSAKWSQDRFVISFWVDPIVPPTNFTAEYRVIKEAGFTTLVGGFGATDPASVTQQVAACEENGLACIPAACETETGPGPSGSCVGVAAAAWGYQMKDEPQSSEFPALAAWSASVAARAPAALRFINLLPNYGFPDSSVYAAYVNDFVQVVRPDVLCFDHYPDFGLPQSSDVSTAGYHRNLAIFRAASQLAGIPFWNFMNTMPFNGRADVSEGQLRWQVFTSLAYGAKGILYFCYWTPSGTSFQWGNGLITPRALPGQTPVYVPGPHFGQVARINAKLGTFGKALLQSASLWLFAANGTKTGAAVIEPSDSLFHSVGGSGAGPLWSVLIGAFSNTSDGSASAFVIQNQDPISPAIVTVTFATGSVPLEVDAETGARIPLADDSPMPGWQLFLAEGDARLIVF